MGVARVFGHAVQVTTESSAGEKVYDISGSGACALHQYCTDHKITVTPLIRDHFQIAHETIKNERIASGDLNRLYFCNSIIDATKDRAIS